MTTGTSDRRAEEPSPLLRLTRLNEPLVRYFFAVLMVGLACLVRAELAGILGDKLTYITFFPAVMVAAMLSGLGPGLLVTGLSAAFVASWMLPPGGIAIGDSVDSIGLAVFVTTGIFLSVMAGLYHRALATVAAFERDQREQLQELVAERTREVLREQAALQKSEHLLRLFVEHAPAAITMLDAQMRHLAVSRRWLADYGKLGQNLIGRSHYEVFPDVPERWKEVHRRCLAGACERAEEDLFVREDGGAQWVCWEVHPWYDAAGAIGGIFIFSEDITQRKLAQQALLQMTEREQFLADVVEKASMPFAVVETDGRMTLFNQAFADLTGYSREELEQKPTMWAMELTPEEWRANEVACLAKAVRSRLPVRYEKEYLRKDGTRLAIELFVQPQFDAAGELLHYRGFLTDITARKQAERAIQQLNEQLEARVHRRTLELEKTVLALESQIAERHRLEREILEVSEREQSRIGQELHEGLGQELAGISMLGNSLARDLQAESHPAAGDAVKITNYIRATIASARQLAKSLYPIDLNHGLVIGLEALAAQTTARFEVRCEVRQVGAAQPLLLKPIKTHLYRIAQECISNALKHGQASHIQIELLVEGAECILTVLDDGSGFKAPADHTGMGLRIMKYRARVIGAHLEICKPAAGGCRVTCRIRQ